jgi:hypothetical protein
MTKDWQKELQGELEAQQAEVSRIEALYKSEQDKEKKYNLSCRLEREQAKLGRIERHMIKVGEKISISPYSDWRSYTIISRTKDTLTARQDRQTHFKDCWQDGELECEPNPNGQVIRFTWSKVSNHWCYGNYKVMVGEYNYEDPSF